MFSSGIGVEGIMERERAGWWLSDNRGAAAGFGCLLLLLAFLYWRWTLVGAQVALSVVMLVAAIWRRLGDYGVTPDRYGIALVAVWVAALVLYLAVRRNRADMRAIIGAAAVLLLVGAAGPWGANGTTIASQFGRLVTLLESTGVLQDGKLVDKGLLPPTEASAGSSIGRAAARSTSRGSGGRRSTCSRTRSWSPIPPISTS